MTETGYFLAEIVGIVREKPTRATNQHTGVQNYPVKNCLLICLSRYTPVSYTYYHIAILRCENPHKTPRMAMVFPCALLKYGGCLSEQQGFIRHTAVMLDGFSIKPTVLGNQKCSGVRTTEEKDIFIS